MIENGASALTAIADETLILELIPRDTWFYRIVESTRLNYMFFPETILVAHPPPPCGTSSCLGRALAQLRLLQLPSCLSPAFLAQRAFIK